MPSSAISRSRNEPKAFLYAFDILELNGTDLRREPIDVRKATLASILRKSRHGVRLNEHPDGEGVFRHPARWARGDRRPGDVRFGYYPPARRAADVLLRL